MILNSQNNKNFITSEASAKELNRKHFYYIKSNIIRFGLSKTSLNTKIQEIFTNSGTFPNRFTVFHNMTNTRFPSSECFTLKIEILPFGFLRTALHFVEQI